jgi:hypothetical protein
VVTPKVTIETPYGGRAVDLPPGIRITADDGVNDGRRITGEFPAMDVPRPASVGVWAKVLSASVAVILLVTGLVTAFFATKRELAIGLAEAQAAALAKAVSVETRTIQLEGKVQAHHEAQASEIPSLERKIEALSLDVQALNVNLIIIGERQEIRGLRKLPSQRVRDVKP